MTKIADAVQNAASRAVAQDASAWLLATVTAIGTSGTVDVTTATGPVPGVRRLRSYAPMVGDVVQVHRNAAGNWLVAGVLASADPAWQVPTMGTGWATGPGGTGSYPPLRWRRDSEDRIHVHGVFHCTTTTPGTPVATGFAITTAAFVSPGSPAVNLSTGGICGWYLNNAGELRLNAHPAFAVNDSYMVNSLVPRGNIA